jgi:hypothetical protein
MSRIINRRQVEEAKKYLRSIKVHVFTDLDKMTPIAIMKLYKINKEMGVKPEDIKDVEFPENPTDSSLIL